MKPLSFVISFALMIYFCQLQTNADNTIPDQSNCGLQLPSGELPERSKYDGREYAYNAPLGQFPWTASIIYEYRNELKFWCSGFLINSRYVVSAAGCFANRHSAGIKHVLLGEYNIATDIDCTEDKKLCAPREIRAEIEKFVLHENFQNDSNIYNIALIRLKNPITFNRFVAPICLPSVVKDFQDSKPNDEILISGVGSVSMYEVIIRDQKIVVYGTVMENKLCSDFYSSNGLNISDVHICIEEGDNACKGFQGSAIMKQANMNWVAEGLLLRDFCKPQRDQLNILPYAIKISHFEDWIRRNLKP